MVNIGNHFFEENLCPGKIYFFKNNQINSDVPHFHILIAIPNNDFLILTCCTSQFEKRARFIELNNLPYETSMTKLSQKNMYKTHSCYFHQTNNLD